MAEWHEKYKNIADGLKNSAMAIGVFVGGGWALFEFVSTQRLSRSALELELLEYENIRQPFVDVQLTASEELVGPDRCSYIVGTVEIKNTGKKTTLVEFPVANPPIKLARVDYSKSIEALAIDGFRQFNFTSLNSKENIFITTDALLIEDASVVFPFMIPISKNGMYMVSFQARAVITDYSDTTSEIALPEKYEDASYRMRTLVNVSNARGNVVRLYANKDGPPAGGGKLICPSYDLRALEKTLNEKKKAVSDTRDTKELIDNN